MDFLAIFKVLSRELSREKIDWALIGGWALQTAGVSRTTLDIDLLIARSNKGKVKELLLAHGCELTHESGDVLNFVGKKVELDRIDFLLAHRKYARAMLTNAVGKETLPGG